MSKVFISYRRDDSSDASGRIYDRLVRDLGPANVFMDVDNIPPGVDFSEHIRKTVQKCSVLLAIINRTWLDGKDGKSRRINDPEDFVRIEIEQALGQKATTVIPVLLHGTAMPAAADLPADMQRLAVLNAKKIDHHSFHQDLDPLVNYIKLHLEPLVDPLPDEAVNSTPRKTDTAVSGVTTAVPLRPAVAANRTAKPRTAVPPSATPHRGVRPPKRKSSSRATHLAILALAMAVLTAIILIGMVLVSLGH
ncbi:toll/interleukin-1 receptor domain-containing protein [Blastopirellula marina]|uniref:TIR domain-containing protein n=1 Tax=Blastopirellula marina TaxID=124 RepID=A0A2S8G9A0_9BACT|nr:toll/interleukin-1 receptor domain-containing protein [Blastopirellula marina]PQO41038.1 hypothetical protein C5Y98_03485 [Blastopirellula marina]PTL45914.1 toll/interleukin-1 receptor domain-containing protein [Blastopirellula marina]